jgi:hypothetical protein
MLLRRRRMTLDEVVVDLIRVAKSNLEDCVREGTDFQHVAFPINLTPNEHGKCGMSIVPLSGDRDERRRQVELIHRNLEVNQCNALVIINDAFATAVPEGMAPEEAIRQKNLGLLKPKEGLITLVVGKDEPARTIVNMYTRHGNKVEWEPQFEPDGFESWMVPPQWLGTVGKGMA